MKKLKIRNKKRSHLQKTSRSVFDLEGRGVPVACPLQHIPVWSFSSPLEKKGKEKA